MTHHASKSFWQAYEALPADVRDLADKNYDLLEQNPQHPALHLNKVGNYWSARVGRDYRAVAVESRMGFFGSGLDLTANMIA